MTDNLFETMQSFIQDGGIIKLQGLEGVQGCYHISAPVTAYLQQIGFERGGATMMTVYTDGSAAIGRHDLTLFLGDRLTAQQMSVLGKALNPPIPREDISR